MDSTLQAPPGARGPLGVLTSRMFALALLIAAGFVLLGVNTRQPGAMTDLDAAIANTLHENGRSMPFAVSLFSVITAIGSASVLGVVGLTVALVLGWRRHYAHMAVWSAAMFGAGILSLWLKYLFQRQRPAFADPFAIEASPSFPSGHALGAMVCYGLLVFLLLIPGRRTWFRLAAAGGLAMLILAIGFSRLYLGVHYTTDVIGGYAVGTVFLIAAGWSLTSIRTGKRAEKAYAKRLNLEGN
jgi:membrane-associated phospholipid phosphatase